MTILVAHMRALYEWGTFKEKQYDIYTSSIQPTTVSLLYIKGKQLNLK